MTDRVHIADPGSRRARGEELVSDDTGMLERGQPQRRSLIKRMLPRSLFGRALVIIVTPVVLVQAISAFVFIERHYDETTERLAEGLAGQIAATVALISDSRVGLDRNEAFSLAGRTMWLSLSFAPGQDLPADIPEPQNTILDARLMQALNERLSDPFAVDTHTLPDDVRIWVETEAGLLRVMVSRKRIFSSTTYLVYFWAVGTAILLVAVALVFMRNQVRPIRRLAIAAERFGKGQDVPAFKPEGATEVRQASAAFIQMRERIKRQISQRTEMLAGVSHDLRTPLTRMKLQLAMLGDTPEAQSLQEDVTQMERMIEDYLAFARGEGTETPTPTKLGELVGEVVAQARRDGDRVTLQLDQELALPLRREVMRRAIANLVSNGLRHGQAVTIRVGRRRHLAEVTVDDDGPGIPRDKREEVFRPFHRLDASRNPRTGGTGLGLTIARDVVRGHGGDLILEDAPGGGLRAKVLLPV
jgi:two-component system osmolarity sensor histidine kinase EnvZ